MTVTEAREHGGFDPDDDDDDRGQVSSETRGPTNASHHLACSRTPIERLWVTSAASPNSIRVVGSIEGKYLDGRALMVHLSPRIYCGL